MGNDSTPKINKSSPSNVLLILIERSTKEVPHVWELSAGQNTRFEYRGIGLVAFFGDEGREYIIQVKEGDSWRTVDLDLPVQKEAIKDSFLRIEELRRKVSSFEGSINRMMKESQIEKAAEDALGVFLKFGA